MDNRAELPHVPASGRGGLAALIGGSVASMFAAFVVLAIVGRAAGETGLGAYMGALAWVMPLALVVDAGVGALVARDLSYPRMPTTRAYLWAALRARLLIGVPVLIALVAAAPVLTGNEVTRDVLVIALPLVVLLPMSGVLAGIFRAAGASRAVQVNAAALVLMLVTFTLAAFGAGWGVTGAAALMVAAHAVHLAVALVIWWRSYAEGETGAPVGVADLLRRGWPLGVSALLALVHVRLNVVVLEHVAVPLAGTYAAAFGLVELGRLVPVIAFESLLPFLSMMVAQPEAFRRTYGLAVRGFAAYGVAFGALVWLLAYALIGLAFGGEFDGAPEVLRVLAWSMLPFALRQARAVYLHAVRRGAWAQRVALLTLAGQGVAALLIIPQHGAIGAAWVLFVSEAVGAAVLWFGRPPANPQ